MKLTTLAPLIGAFAGLVFSRPADDFGVHYPLKRATQAIQRVNDFGANTSGSKMYIYVPSKLADSPAIIVAIHYCSGTANAYYTGSPYAQLADQKGFIVIYPESPYSGTCWDVSSKAALTHNGGGDSNSIANMVTYAIGKYKADTTKVFVTGSSSGAMMTVGYPVFPTFFSSLADALVERHGRNLPRDVRGRHRLLGRGRRLLHVGLGRDGLVEQLVRAGPSARHHGQVGPGREGHVPRLHGRQAQDADLPRIERWDPAAAQL